MSWVPARSGLAMSFGLVNVLERQRNLEERLAAVEGRGDGNAAGDELVRLRSQAWEKLETRANLTREEAAAHLGVSTRKLQRLEARGELPRCSGLGRVVRYAARDVLRLASAR